MRTLYIFSYRLRVLRRHTVERLALQLFIMPPSQPSDTCLSPRCTIGLMRFEEIRLILARTSTASTNEENGRLTLLRIFSLCSMPSLRRETEFSLSSDKGPRPSISTSPLTCSGKGTITTCNQSTKRMTD